MDQKRDVFRKTMANDGLVINIWRKRREHGICSLKRNDLNRKKCLLRLPPNYIVAVQLTQDLCRGWVVIHAKFEKISQNIVLVILIRNFGAGRLV